MPMILMKALFDRVAANHSDYDRTERIEMNGYISADICAIGFGSLGVMLAIGFHCLP